MQDTNTTGKRLTKKQRARALNDQAVQAHLGGAIASALDQYARAARLDPINATVQSNYGFLLAQTGALRDATRHLRRAVKLAPDSATAWSNLGQALAAAGEVAEGMNALQRATGLAPDDADCWGNRSRLELVAGQLDAAEASLHRALALDPENPAAATRLATVFALSGRVAAARELLIEITSRAPGYGDAWVQLGVVCCTQNDLGLARRALQTALGINRRDVLALKHLALVELGCGDREAALANYLEALGITPHDPSLRIDAAVLALSMGRAAGAIELLNEVADARPELEERASFYRGLAHCEGGDGRQGQRLLQTVAAGGGDYAERARAALTAAA